MISVSEAFALGQSPGGESMPGGLGALIQFVPLVLIFAIFYFLLIRPQQKRARDHQNFLSSLQKGLEVTTAGGIIGRVTNVADKVVTIEIADNVRIKVLKAHIAGPGPEKEEKKG